MIDFGCLVRRLGIPKLAWPTRVIEYARLSPQGNISIYQRGAAQAAADKNINVRVNVKVEESRSGANLGAFRRMTLHLGDSLRRTVGVFTGLKLAAPLENADLLSGPRQT
jgi:hypothetical protein